MPQPRDDLILALYKEGAPVTQIAERAGDLVARIASDHGVSQPCVRRVAARAGVPPRHGWQRRYPLDEAAFDRPTRVGWWLIGLLAADGSIHAPENRISLCQSMKDVDVLHAFYEYVGCPGRPLTMLNLSDEAQARQLPRGPAAEARVFSGRLVSALARHGVVPQKTASMQLGDPFNLSCAKAEAAARVLLGASPTSMRRKRALLAQIAGRTA